LPEIKWFGHLAIFWPFLNVAKFGLLNFSGPDNPGANAPLHLPWLRYCDKEIIKHINNQF